MVLKSFNQILEDNAKIAGAGEPNKRVGGLINDWANAIDPLTVSEEGTPEGHNPLVSSVSELFVTERDFVRDLERCQLGFKLAADLIENPEDQKLLGESKALFEKWAAISGQLIPVEALLKGSDRSVSAILQQLHSTINSPLLAEYSNVMQEIGLKSLELRILFAKNKILFDNNPEIRQCLDTRVEFDAGKRAREQIGTMTPVYQSVNAHLGSFGFARGLRVQLLFEAIEKENKKTATEGWEQNADNIEASLDSLKAMADKKNGVRGKGGEQDIQGEQQIIDDNNLRSSEERNRQATELFELVRLGRDNKLSGLEGLLSLISQPERYSDLSAATVGPYVHLCLSQYNPKKFGPKSAATTAAFNVDPAIKDALGYQSIGFATTPCKVFCFDPQKLDALYLKDRDPVWKILKSSIPVSSIFPFKEKLKSLHEVADLLMKDKKIASLNSYQQVLGVALQAMSLVKTKEERQAVLNGFGYGSTIYQFIQKGHAKHLDENPREADPAYYNFMEHKVNSSLVSDKHEKTGRSKVSPVKKYSVLAEDELTKSSSPVGASPSKNNRRTIGWLMAGLGLVLGSALLFTPLLPLGAAMIVGSFIGGGALIATAFDQPGDRASPSKRAANLAKPDAADELDAFIKYEHQNKSLARLARMPEATLDSFQSSRSVTPTASESSLRSESDDEDLGIDVSREKLTSSPTEVSSKQKVSSQSDHKKVIRSGRGSTAELPPATFSSFDPGTSPVKKSSASEEPGETPSSESKPKF